MRTPAGAAAFKVAVAVTALCCAGAALIVVLLLVMPGTLAALRTLQENSWWFHYTEPVPGALPAAVCRIGAAVLAACIAVLGAFRGLSLYRKGGSPLIPFLIVFLFSLSLECLRAGIALLYSVDSSIAAGVVLTRVVYWGRFVGLLALLVSSLYCIDLKYRKFVVLIGVDFLVSFAMAAYIPIDRTVYLAQLTWKLGDEQGVWFVNISIGILTVLTAATSAATRRDPRFLWFAAGFLLLLTARELLFFAGSPLLLAAALAALVAGIVVFLRVLSVIYRRTGSVAVA
jgi:hypothetical protein